MNMLQNLYQKKETNSILECKGPEPQKKESYSLLQALQESGQESSSEDQEQAPQEKEDQKEALMEQLSTDSMAPRQSAEVPY